MWQTFKSIPELEQTVQTLTRERDSARKQLAPFLAIAANNFPQYSPAHQLKDLVGRRDTLEERSEAFERKRQLSLAQYESFVKKLRAVPKGSLEISCKSGDSEAYELGKQIREAFRSAGWKVSGLNAFVDTTPLKGVKISLNPRTSEDVLQALSSLLPSLGYPNVAQPSENLEDGKIEILVGER
jgi:hypothetical protein